MKKLSLGLMLLAAIACAAAAGGTKESGRTFFLNIGTGGTAGTYYPMGGAMAEVISANVPGVNATAVSTGASAANVNKLKGQELQLIFVQNDIAYQAYNGTEGFKDTKYTGLRGVASLYSETIQIVTVSSTGIRSFADLRGKRIAVGAAGSGTEINARQILETVGLTYNDISPQYLSFAEASSALRDGNVDAAINTAGIPTAAIRDLASQKDIVIIPIPADIANRLIAKYPFYTKFTIPANTYSKQISDVPTVAVKAMLAVDESMDAETVYRITKAIFTNLDKIALSHAQGKAIKKETALEGISIPMHPGAERFFKE